MVEAPGIELCRSLRANAAMALAFPPPARYPDRFDSRRPSTGFDAGRRCSTRRMETGRRPVQPELGGGSQ